MDGKSDFYGSYFDGLFVLVLYKRHKESSSATLKSDPKVTTNEIHLNL